ncbi:hypothetical protein PVAP13_4KG004324 [Panicum virgatum]|uniref:DUF4220 domain-containing protein n=1 Tax=Panicum virgatum TaxID=38727 RepID=A0A8T0TM44_PANVG|nr:hypothetical protein PVAP13_4KG004324 [Panicum virgatum]
MIFSNRTGYYYCNSTLAYVSNLTYSYTDQKNEPAITSIFMLFLAAIFFIVNLFSRFSDVSAFLKPSIRICLYVLLSLFLPVMSYVFSEAKNQGTATGEVSELPLRAQTILMWMLLVELLHKKVEAIFLATADMHGYAGTIERAARISWLGYLVFYNLRSTGRKAFFGVLWLLAATKLVQRFVTSELGKRSFAYGRNPQLVASYMTQILQQDEEELNGQQIGSELLKRCKYAVMGEEELKKEARSKGYRLDLKEVIAEADSAVVVTIGGIWRLSDKDQMLQRDSSLKRLCLSFALYKLLRRRLEDFPITPAEARNCHSLIFKGLWEEDKRKEENADELFQVLNDEIQFLCEYYHSVHPVTYAGPSFFLINYIMFPIVVWALCILMIILCNNGDVVYAFHSFRTDNFPVSIGMLRMVVCLLSKANQLPPVLFSTVNLFITTLLSLTFAYEEVWEIIVFLLSNGFTVSLLCRYTSKRNWRASRFLSGIIRRILWVRNKLSRPNVCFKQFSMLWCFFRASSSFMLPTEAVPRQAKKAIVERLATARDDVALPGKQSALQFDELELSWACDGDDDLAEVILTWHIATELLEARFPLPKKTPPGPGRKVAVGLSRYCAYLVAFHPELLPVDKDATERVYEELNKELKNKSGCYGYFFCRERKVMEIAAGLKEEEESPATVFGKGASLGKVLMDRYEAAAEADARDRVWELLAGLWTEVVVYAAPTASEQHVKAHKEALAQGGEFITLLWAVATHTGISRRDDGDATPPTTSSSSSTEATEILIVTEDSSTVDISSINT